ncbi:MAG: DUF4388 domain-containing protein [Nitrospirae bacterium]|nr:DUF4388 domain-containing protein [Nitrospirota bacterium]
MAFTGDLELLNIVDIIQLLNTTRKSGTFTVRSSRGESRIIFSNGYIVGASHLDNRVRIGTVLVKMNAISPKDLEEMLAFQKQAGTDRKPLIATLIETGRLTREDAAKGLKKLIEMTLVELIGWTKGTFTLDTDAVAASPGCSYPISKMEQEVSLDAQMILMDALRIFDERERDRNSGKPVPSDEELFADVIPGEETAANGGKGAGITADDLGLGNLDRLERKIPEASPAGELFDPAEIHRQKIKGLLSGFTPEEQEAFVSFLGKPAASRLTSEEPAKRGPVKGLVLFSEDDLLKHSVMTICKDEGVLVFATDGEEELFRIIEQCLKIKVLPVLMFDVPGKPGGMFSPEKIVSLRQQARERYPKVPVVQMASLQDYPFILQSFRDGIRAVFPRPSEEAGKATFIGDMIAFLDTFKSYIRALFDERQPAATDSPLAALKERVLTLRELNDPSSVSLLLLRCLSETCERCVTFIVRPAELIGERALGVHAGREAGPTSAAGIRIPLTKPSVFQAAVEKGTLFCGDSDDEVLKRHLFEGIGAPLRPKVLLLPLKSRGRTVAVLYGDFGSGEPAPVQSDMLEILAHGAGLVVENAFYRKQLNAASRK